MTLMVPLSVFLCFFWSVVLCFGEENIWSKKEIWQEEAKKIMRLPPSAFSEIPQSVARDLKKRGCTIPQWGIVGRKNGKEPMNVISGEFQKSGQTDWAALCSINDASTILVFWNGSAENIAQLGGFSPDKGWLQGMVMDQKTGDPMIEFSRIISPVGKKFIMVYYEAFGGFQPPPIDHEGIENTFLDKYSTVHYWYEGKWLALQGAD